MTIRHWLATTTLPFEVIARVSAFLSVDRVLCRFARETDEEES